ncbi:unnamed protein product [Larinioides sclopetarius]|uniref:Photosystem II protein I n=1 Tax=Larinioides sclopetarius TaxID=280406 RepID=A0AAV2B1C7_9ARAC
MKRVIFLFCFGRACRLVVNFHFKFFLQISWMP